MKQDSVPEIKIPIGIAGDGGVGKSTLVAAALTGYLTKTYQRTVKLDRLQKTLVNPETNEEVIINEKIGVKSYIWDFGGQLAYRTFVESVINVGGAFVLTFDLTDDTTLNSLVDYWVPMIEKSFEELEMNIPPAIVYGSKGLLPESNIDFFNKQKEVDITKALDCDYVKTIRNKLGGIDFIKAVMIGDTIGYEKNSIPSLVHIIQGPRSELKLETNIKAPISLSSIYGLQAQGLTDLLDKNIITWLKENNLEIRY
ncbi:MAG: hypothetical protein WC307_03720 [Candidatus Nanoarchaeia archaeon]|jgi:hypothetical protein